MEGDRGGESLGRTEVALGWGGQPSTSSLPTEPQGTEGGCLGGRGQESSPRLRAPEIQGEAIPKVSKKKASQLSGTGAGSPVPGKACRPGPSLPGLDASSRRPRGARAAWGEAAPGQGGPVALTQAPALTRVFFPPEPEAGRECDDSDCRHRDTRLRQTETEAETEAKKARGTDTQRDKIQRYQREADADRDRHRDTRRKTRDLMYLDTQTQTHSACLPHRVLLPPIPGHCRPSPAGFPHCLWSPQAPRHLVPHVSASVS